MFVTFEGNELLVYDHTGRIAKLIKNVQYYKKYSDTVFVATTKNSLEVVSEVKVGSTRVVSSICDTDYKEIHFKDDYIFIVRDKPLKSVDIYNSNLICVAKLYKDLLSKWKYIKMSMRMPTGFVHPIAIDEHKLYGRKGKTPVCVDLKENTINQCNKKDIKGTSLRFLHGGI